MERCDYKPFNGQSRARGIPRFVAAVSDRFRQGAEALQAIAKRHAEARQAREIADAIAAGKAGYQIPEGFVARVLRDRADVPIEAKTLTDNPKDRLLVLLQGTDGLNLMLGKQGDERLLAVGWTPEYVKELRGKNYRFRLVVFPKPKELTQANWNSLEGPIRTKYGNEVADRVAKAIPLLSAKPFHETFSELEGQFLARTGKHFKDIKPGDPLFMNKENFLASAGTPEDVRRFLYDTLRLTELFTGEGYTVEKDPAHPGQYIRGLNEYLVPNQDLDTIPGAALVDLN